MAKKKEFKPVAFTAEVDGKSKKFEIVRPSVIVPGYGKFTASQLVEDNERAQLALAKIIERNSPVIQEVVAKSKKGGE